MVIGPSKNPMNKDESCRLLRHGVESFKTSLLPHSTDQISYKDNLDSRRGKLDLPLNGSSSKEFYQFSNEYSFLSPTMIYLIFLLLSNFLRERIVE